MSTKNSQVKLIKTSPSKFSTSGNVIFIEILEKKG